MSKPIKLSLAQLKAAAAAGKANFEVAEEFGVSRSTVTYICRVHRIKLVKKTRWGRPIGCPQRISPPLTASMPEIARYMKAHGL